MNRRPIALITGATSGIGESCAHKFAQAGYNLIVTARRSDLLACLKRKLERQRVEVLPLVFDVRDRQAAHDAIAGLPQEWAEVDVLVNNDSPNADRGLVNESLNKEIERALSTLAPREREIIKSFFGIGCQEMTLEEIGERFGLTRERVRQIKEKAIRKLKNNSRSKLLKSYLG